MAITAAPIMNSTVGPMPLQARDDGSVLLPDGYKLADALFETNEGGLLVTWPDGTTADVEEFSAATSSLIDSDGVQMSGDMAVQLAQIDSYLSETPTTMFDLGDTGIIGGTDGAPIGNVEDASGTIFVIRLDGTRLELEVGDPVFQGDILESGADGSVGIVLADETTFSMGEDGRMVLDEMIYDPDSQTGSVSLSVLEGVFTIVSGQVAKTDPDAMTVDSPVATIGIRGTQIGISIRDGDDMSVVLMEEADGFVGEVVVQNDGGTVILNTAFAGTNVGSFEASPADGHLVNQIDFLLDFGSSLKSLPGVHSANAYGVNEANLDILIEEAIRDHEQSANAAAEEPGVPVREENDGEGFSDSLQVIETPGDGTEGADKEGSDTDAGNDQLPIEETLEDEELRRINVTEPREGTDLQNPEIFSLSLNERRDEQGLTETVSPKFRVEHHRDDNFVAQPDAQPVANPVANILNKIGDSNGISVGARTGGGGYDIVGSADSILNADFSDFEDDFNIDLSLSTGDNSVYLGTGGDTVTTGSGADYVHSGDGDDTVNTGSNDDLIHGGSGNGDDTYIGGDGTDWVIYPSAKHGHDLLINLDAQNSHELTLSGDRVIAAAPGSATDITTSSADDTWIGNDTLNGIENIMAGEGDDVVIGSTVDNVLVGNLGDDVLLGGAGNDTLIGGSTYNNNATGVAGYGFLGDGSAISGVDGNDYLDGGTGTDTAVFGGTFADYTVAIDNNNNVTLTRGSNTDTLVSIEKLRFDNDETVTIGTRPDLMLEAETVDADSGTAIGLGIFVAIADDGVGELGEIAISGIPAGSVINDGAGNVVYSETDTGPLSVTSDQLEGLSIEPPDYIISEFTLNVTASRADSFAFTSSTSLLVNVEPVASAPELSVSDNTIDYVHGQGITFDITTATTDVSEIISSVEVRNIPEGSKLYVSVGEPASLVQVPVVNGVSSIPVDLGTTVFIDVPDDFIEDFDLVVVSTSEEKNGNTASSEAYIHVNSDSDDDVFVAEATSADATDGEDHLHGSDGNDTLSGGVGNDTILAGSGDDALNGNAGDDVIYGGAGDDTVTGGGGNDMLHGGDGADTLNGGAGDDVLYGGAGADTFIVDAESGSSIISDIMAEDSIVFNGQEFRAEDMVFSENADGDVEIAFNGDAEARVTLEGVKYADMDKDSNGQISENEGYSVTEESDQITVTINTEV